MTSIEPYEQPGLFRVFASAVYDTIVVAGIIMLAATLVIIPANLLFNSENIGHFLLFRLYILAVTALFFIWFWTHGGQTVGMRAWRIKLQQPNGKPVTPGQATKRLIAATFFIPAFGIGFLWMLVDRDHKTLHDRIAGTVLTLIDKH